LNDLDPERWKIDGFTVARNAAESVDHEAAQVLQARVAGSSNAKTSAMSSSGFCAETK
jgi:hypothetical protein